eukprot:359047-Chlamydomonas_euryale.AAC.8
MFPAREPRGCEGSKQAAWACARQAQVLHKYCAGVILRGGDPRATITPLAPRDVRPQRHVMM